MYVFWWWGVICDLNIIFCRLPFFCTVKNIQSTPIHVQVLLILEL